MPEPLPRAFGRYELLARLGVGGMAEVFLARMHTSGSITKTVVLKKILRAYADDPGFIAMFRDEAKVSLGLTHANVVQVFDFGEQDGELFLVMEHVRGKNLREFSRALAAKEANAIPSPLALHIAAEVAKGLHHAHTRKDDAGVPLAIVHRDVSPHNILLSFDGDVKIADFGIAKARVRSIEKTQVGMLKGKLPYLAPELLAGHDAGPRSDVWALGATLWEMLTGRRLLDAPNDAGIVEQQRRHEPFPPPSSLVQGIAADIDRLVARAIVKDPAQRFESALAFARDAARAAAIDGTGDLEFAMSFAFGNGPAPAWVGAPVEDDVTERSAPTVPRAGPVPRVPLREPTTGSRRPREVLELEMPFEAAGEGNALSAHFRDGRAFLEDSYAPQDGKRCMFIATEEKEILTGTVILVVLTFERPVDRFCIGARVLLKRPSGRVVRGMPQPAGILVEIVDGDSRELYEYLGFPD